MDTATLPILAKPTRYLCKASAPKSAQTAAQKVGQKAPAGHALGAPAHQDRLLQTAAANQVRYWLAESASRSRRMVVLKAGPRPRPAALIRA